MTAALDRLFGVEGRVAIVLGRTPIGEAAAAALEAAGATVELHAADSGAGADILDITDPAAIAELFDHVASRHGKLDTLVYAATRIGAYPIEQMSPAQWDGLHQVNVRGAFLAVQAAIPHLRRSGDGRIVAVSTMGARHPVLHGNAGYGASKAGLEAMIRAVALDCAADGIRANMVCPGAVPAGPPPADAPPSAGPAFQPGRLLLGPGSPEDIAAAILYLCAPASRFMTGQALMLDGGFLIA